LEDLHSLLNECKDLLDVFVVVKKAVEDILGQRRAGLMLGLSDLPMSVEAFYMVGSNIIVMNENIYYKVLEESPDTINTWSFRILLHEYLHSLGYKSEIEVQILVREISGSLERSLVTEIPEYTLHYFPLHNRHINRRKRRLSDFKIKLVKGFDRSSTKYIT